MRGGAKLSWASVLMLQARAAWCRGQAVCMLPAGGLRCTLLSVGCLPCMYCTFLCPHFHKAKAFHVRQRMCSKRHVGSSHTAEPLGRLSAQGLPTSRMGSEACSAAQSEPFQKLLAMIRSNSQGVPGGGPHPAPQELHAGRRPAGRNRRCDRSPGAQHAHRGPVHPEL